jgi:hypothetical protein
VTQCLATNATAGRENYGARCSRPAVTGARFCTHHGGLNDTKTPQKVRRRVSQPRIRCSRIKANGEQCKRWSRAGTTVCDSHGGKAPQTMAKAKERLFAAVDPVMSKLVEIALDDSRGNEQVRAATFLLERAGFTTKLEITAEVKPWEGLVSGLLVDQPDEIEGEVVDDPLDYYAREVTAQAIEAGPDAEMIPFPKPAERERSSNPKPPKHIREGLGRLS